MRTIHDNYKKGDRKAQLETGTNNKPSYILYWCRDLNLVPRGLRFKLPILSKIAQKIAKNVGLELVRDRMFNNHWRKHELQSEISSKLASFLERVSMTEDRRRIQKCLDESY